jgi:hypothetical protein
MHNCPAAQDGTGIISEANGKGKKIDVHHSLAVASQGPLQDPLEPGLLGLYWHHY